MQVHQRGLVQQSTDRVEADLQSMLHAAVVTGKVWALWVHLVTHTSLIIFHTKLHVLVCVCVCVCVHARVCICVCAHACAHVCALKKKATHCYQRC